MHTNPFTNRGMIQEESAFVGRSREITNILNRLRNGSSVSLVGERRIGKSSLLYHLYLTGKRRLEEERYQFLYLDMHDARMRTPAHFAATVMHHLGIGHNKHDNEYLQQKPMFLLADALEEHQRQQQARPILLLDEFESITKHKELFNDDFLEALRSFCNSRLLTVLTASKHTLKVLTERENLTSPFYNIFAMVPLKEFIVNEYLDEVQEFINCYWNSAYQLNEHENAFLQSYQERHPLKLQVISYWILENRNLQYSDTTLQQEIENELQSYF